MTSIGGLLDNFVRRFESRIDNFVRDTEVNFPNASRRLSASERVMETSALVENGFRNALCRMMWMRSNLSGLSWIAILSIHMPTLYPVIQGMERWK